MKFKLCFKHLKKSNCFFVEEFTKNLAVIHEKIAKFEKLTEYYSNFKPNIIFKKESVFMSIK